MSNDGGVNGVFWAPDSQQKSSGILSHETAQYRLDLDSFIVSPQQMRVRRSDHQVVIEHIGDPATIAADFKPRVIHGMLKNGDALTLFDAHMRLDESLLAPTRQYFTGYRRIVGAHVASAHEDATSVRWVVPVRVDSAGWLDVPPICREWGSLRGWSEGGWAGLEFTPSKAGPLGALAELVPSSVTTLLTIWTGASIQPAGIQLRLVSGRWCRYGAVELNHVRSIRPGDPLRASRLTLDQFASWVTASSTLGPLPFIAMSENETLQVAAHSIAAALEGLHRRLYAAGRYFASVPKAAVRKAGKVAALAAADELTKAGWPDPGEAVVRFRQALSHVDQPTYRERLREVVMPIFRIAPGLLGPNIDEWLTLMSNVRNEQSHQLLDANDFGDRAIRQYYVAAASGRWVLKLRMLLEVLPEAQLQEALLHSNRFAFALANIDREALWPGYSGLDSFRAAPGVD